MKQKVEKSFLTQEKPELKVREVRYFSEAFKKEKVEDLVAKRISIKDLCAQYNVTRTSVYNWLYLYSPHHSQKTKQVIEMQSEATKTQFLQTRVAELERIIGQKQLEIDFQNKLFDLASTELGYNVKKNFSFKLSNTIV